MDTAKPTSGDLRSVRLSGSQVCDRGSSALVGAGDRFRRERVRLVDPTIDDDRRRSVSRVLPLASRV
jgi:hypothetical protein